MFSKKQHLDLKKSSLKVLDPKRDSTSRLKHLKIIIESCDAQENKNFFEANYSHIYFIFHDVFQNVELNLRQRVQKAYREELDIVKFVLEKILIYLPELLHRRWQCHSIQVILKKFLHHANPTRLRREGIRLFLLWYQILGENSLADMDTMFCTLVPGLNPKFPNPFLLSTLNADPSIDVSVFYSPYPVVSDEISIITPPEIIPLIPAQSSELTMEDPTCFYLECLLELMVSQVSKIEWKDRRDEMFRSCFNFLFTKFKFYYLPLIFPKFNWSASIYNPRLVLPELRYERDLLSEPEIPTLARKSTLPECQVVVVKWVSSYTQSVKPPIAPPPSNCSSVDRSTEASTTESAGQVVGVQEKRPPVPDPNSRPDNNNHPPPLEEHSYYSHLVVRDTLYSSRENINLVHELFKQAFCFPFTYANMIRKAILVYKEWIHKSLQDLPVFLQEPMEPDPSDLETPPSEVHTSSTSIPYTCLENSPEDLGVADLGSHRLRKESYLRAVMRPIKFLRAGLQKVLQVFIINASNVFLLELIPGREHLLEEQVDVTKRVLNIYRYMVMNVQMETKTWEQLLLTLLQIAAQVIKPTPPPRKPDILGGRLAPALFQTLIVTWIRANLNVVVSLQLWDRFLAVLSSLTQWEELVSEWAKTMDTLTRVLAKQVYHLDMNDLPLERLSEQKQKKKRGMKNPPSLGDSSSILGPITTTTAQPPPVLDATEAKVPREENSRPSLRVDIAPPPPTPSTESQSAATSNTQGSGRSRSGSTVARKCTHSSSSYTPEHTLAKSCSDSKLCVKKYDQDIYGPTTQQPAPPNPPQNSTGVPPVHNEEMVQMLAVAEQYIRQHEANKGSFTRSKSLDFTLHRAESPIFSEMSEVPSRSPSPTPSTGMESTSIKDSPMQIDVAMSSAENSCNTSEVGAPSSQSVMAGGSRRGWTADVAVVLWKRMLGALGNINNIPDPTIHSRVMDYLTDLSATLIKIRDNLGVTSDNQSSPPPPELIPPIPLILPWLFETVRLPSTYAVGKMKAYQLLARLTLRRQDIALSPEQLTQLYLCLHQGLVSSDPETLVACCGPRYFCHPLPGHSLLLLDFISAANTVALSKTRNWEPRSSALFLLSSLLGWLVVHTDVKALKPTAAELLLIPCDNAKDHIISILLRSAKSEPAGLVRCIALNSLGIFVYQEMVHKTNHPRVREAILVLLSALRFTVKSVAHAASDILLFLCDHAEYMREQYQDIPCQIVETFVYTLSNLLPGPNTTISDEEKRFLINLIFCLGEWCMHLPLSFLSPSKNSQLLLHSVFEVLHFAASGQKGVPSSHKLELCTFELEPTSVEMESTRGSPPAVSEPESYFYRTAQPLTDPKSNSGIVQLTARTLMNHLLLHLGHFPMGVGAASLASHVTEADDVPHLEGAPDLAIFSAPNVQFFVLNQSAVVSFVEISAPESSSDSQLLSSPSRVRVIVRDLGGKFCWDSALLYGTQQQSEPMVSPVFLQRPGEGGELPVISSSSMDIPSNLVSNPSSSTTSISHRRPSVLPTAENTLPGHDNLDDLLQYVGHSSPECVLQPGRPLNTPTPALRPDHERDLVRTVNSQWSHEGVYAAKHDEDPSMLSNSVSRPVQARGSSPFQFSRLLIDQLGYTSWEQRPHFDLLRKNEKVLRELKNLDKQKLREAHKIAVIYVARGQEDKNSVLLNTGGSQEYEDFIAGLGWEVELESHYGFLGGLTNQKQHSGETTVYYATSLLEVIFHVSTRMPAVTSDDSLTRKLRHLGNDEIHVVWSEHIRDYRRGIIATEFCDVLIVIYPLGNHLYRIQINSKPEVPFFGPLYNDAIVDRRVLPGLVRATAINASRALRHNSLLYQHFFEERVRALDQIIQNRELTPFEQFAANVMAPSSSAGVTHDYQHHHHHHPTINATVAPTVPYSSRPLSMSSSTEKSPRFSPTIRAHNLRERPFSTTSTAGLP